MDWVDIDTWSHMINTIFISYEHKYIYIYQSFTLTFTTKLMTKEIWSLLLIIIKYIHSEGNWEADVFSKNIRVLRVKM